MTINKVIVCPICEKRTWLRILDGGYLNEYPIRIHCANCRALIKGIYVMTESSLFKGLHIFNARIEECDIDSNRLKIKNADYIAEISGELPCRKIRVCDGNAIQESIFLRIDGYIDIQSRINRLSYFARNMEEWKTEKSVAFQLLDEGSIEFIGTALKNRMGEYSYQCDNYLKSLHCLQEVVLAGTKNLFIKQSQGELIASLFGELARVDSNALNEFVERLGGIEALLESYRKAIEVFSSFMSIYPNILPAETYMQYKRPAGTNIGISTCSFTDIKSFYQDAYESLLSLMIIPVCLDNIILRGNYLSFICLKNIQKRGYYVDDYDWYSKLDNGMKLRQIQVAEPIEKLIGIPGNRILRNGIGHNNVKYDGITQVITVFDQKDPTIKTLEMNLIDVAVACIHLTVSAVLIGEIILYILRNTCRIEGIRSISHPLLYNKVGPNEKCPCGSGIKYKKCCKKEIEKMTNN